MRVIDLGQRNYRDVLTLQQKRLAEVVGDASHEGFLLLVEHVPPVLTLGRSAKAEHILADEATLRRAGIEVHEITRGGDVTYHGPGQLVAYPIIRLTPDGAGGTPASRSTGVPPVSRMGFQPVQNSPRSQDGSIKQSQIEHPPSPEPLHGREARATSGVREYVHGLEQAIIDCLATFGLSATRRAGATGVWIGDEKIAAIGVAVRRWVTWHGLALNVNVNRTHFNYIVPCGLRHTGITDMASQLGRAITVGDVKPVLTECLRNILL